jgi:hypothetical protein
MAYISAEATVF